ncbi:MAG: RNA polymerase sigma factor [Gaiellaceae bacterium]
MLALALSHVGSRAVAEEVVQEAWLTVLRDLDRFEGRSDFRTWVLGIVVNLARSRARGAPRRAHLGRARGPGRGTVSVPALQLLSLAGSLGARPGSLGRARGRAPRRRDAQGDPGAIAGLPPAQREVLVLRDIEGPSAAETCNVLGLTDTKRPLRRAPREDSSRSGGRPTRPRTEASACRRSTCSRCQAMTF